jgi:hypothetical protein
MIADSKIILQQVAFEYLTPFVRNKGVTLNG